VFRDADKNNDGFVERTEFGSLMQGYFNSKHMRQSKDELNRLFDKCDFNSDGKISFDEFDIFVRMVFESEYIPALEEEMGKRGFMESIEHHQK